MITEIIEHKGFKFSCDNPNCEYTISSDATSNFAVKDFNFCPHCGWKQGEIEQDKPEFGIRVIACEVMKHQKNYSEDTCHMFSKGVQAMVIALEEKMRHLQN